MKITATLLLNSALIVFPLAARAEVQFEGSLRSMHHGDYSGRVDLHKLTKTPGLTAVGPLEQLQGEFTAFKGKLYSTQVVDGKLQTQSETPNLKASFLVWSHPKKWTPTVPLQLTADTLTTLEQKVELKAQALGIDAEKPFTFALSGHLDRVDYHVLSTPQAGMKSTDHKAGASKLVKQNSHGILVGFYSKHHAGVFTHKGSRIHLHVIDGEHAGHVDALNLGGVMQIEFAQSY